MSLGGFISKIVVSVTKTTFQFNKTLDVLIARFKDSCPPTSELIALIAQKNQINGALQQIQQKIIILNKIASTSEAVVDGVKAGVTIIKAIPIPTSVPPGVGIPVSIINMFSDALDTLGTMIDKEEGSLDSIPEALDLISKDVGEVITKLNEFDVAINDCAENDPGLNEDDLTAASESIDLNFVEVLTDEQLELLLKEPPGLLYGDYYLRLNYINSEFSFDKKQVTAQNKESVPPPGEFYKAGAPIEMLYGDKSFSSSNLVLVNEMKWLIDTKDLIFPPPEPAEDPMKAILKLNQVLILTAIFGAGQEEAEELYEIAWDLSQNKGWWRWKYNDIITDAFDNGKTILEQSVAFIGDEWKEGLVMLDSTIKTLFLGDLENEGEIKVYLSLLKFQGKALYEEANKVGGNYNWHSRRWDEDDKFLNTPDARLYPYSERLAVANESIYNDATIGQDFLDLRPIMHRRKRRWQAIFEVANYLSLKNPKIRFNDPLAEYFISKEIGYNTPIVNGINVIGNSETPITEDELISLYELEKEIVIEWWMYNADHQATPPITANGVWSDGFYSNLDSYAKTQVMLKLLTALGISWYNLDAEKISEFPFWGITWENTQIFNDYNDPNRNLDPSDKWYFAFGKNGLPVPTGS